MLGSPALILFPALLIDRCAAKGMEVPTIVRRFGGRVLIWADDPRLPEITAAFTNHPSKEETDGNR